MRVAVEEDQTLLRIDLGEGRSATIDRADAELIAGFSWYPAADGYVATQRGNLNMYLHRLIAGAGPLEIVDHANGDKLDNRSSNLRIATASQNGANRGPDRRRLGTSSRHKGVCFDRSRGKWAAYIHVNGKTRALGRYPTEDAAARAYNRAALAAWGEFARLNDVEAACA